MVVSFNETIRNLILCILSLVVLHTPSFSKGRRSKKKRLLNQMSHTWGIYIHQLFNSHSNQRVVH